MSTSPETRLRLLGATLRCVDRWGLAKTSLEDVANEAGLSRATVYRYFPGGREELISATVAWEVGNFFSRIEEVASRAPDLTTTLVDALVFGHRAIHEHRVMQQVLSTEPEALLTEISATNQSILAVVRSYVRELLRSESLRPGIDADEASEYLARMFLSHLGSHGQWDLSDPDEVRRLVTSQFTGGILEGSDG